VTDAPGPALARLRLATHLRTLRDERPAADVARAMHWSLSKLNRIENNKVTIQPVEVRALAQHYGVRDEAEVERLVQLSLASRQRMWWREEHQLDDDYLNFIAFENDASHIYGYQSSYLPPLLQTRAYAEALTASLPRKPPQEPRVQKVVDVRMKRQETLMQRLAGDNPPSLSQAVDEGVLLRPIGGRRVMLEQLDHLLEMSRQPTVTLTVLPLALGAHPGLGGPFELLTFSEDNDLDVVFIETPGTDFLITDEEYTSTFRQIMRSLLETDSRGDSLEEAVARARKTFVQDVRIRG